MPKDRALSNRDIARILLEMAALCDMHGLEYKQRAYHWAAADVSIYPEEVSELYRREGIKGLTKIPSVGSRIAKHISELLTTGHFREYEKLKKNVPVNISELLLVESVGPKTIRELWRRLRVKNIADLEKACCEGKLRNLPRFGIKSQERILRSIRTLKGEHDI